MALPVVTMISASVMVIHPIALVPIVVSLGALAAPVPEIVALSVIITPAAVAVMACVRVVVVRRVSRLVAVVPPLIGGLLVVAMVTSEVNLYLR